MANIKVIFLIAFFLFGTEMYGQETMQTSPSLISFDSNWDLLYFNEKEYHTCLDDVFHFYGFYNSSDPNSSHIKGWLYVLLFDDATLTTRYELDDYYPNSHEDDNYYFEKAIDEMFTGYNFHAITSPKVFYIEIRYLTEHLTKHTLYYNASKQGYENIMRIARTFYPYPKPGRIYLDNNTSITTKTIYHLGDPGQVYGTPGTGGNESYTYKWYAKEGNGWRQLIGATSTSFHPGNLTTSQTYRRTDIPSQCASSLSSNQVSVIVRAPLHGGKIGNNQTICYGHNVTVKNITDPTGSDGSYTYTWQKSSDGLSFQDIPGSNSIDYISGNLLHSVYYRRKTSSGGSTAHSNAVLITVRNKMIPGEVSSDQTICHAEAPMTLTSTLPSGGDNAFTYQWQQSFNGNDWDNIQGAKDINFQPSALPRTTMFRRMVSSGCGFVTSNAVTIAVREELSPGKINGNQEICYAHTPAQLTGTLPAGGDGNFTYQWQLSMDAVEWSDIANGNAINYQPTSLVKSTFYRRTVHSGSGCGFRNSNPVVITVMDEIQPGTIQEDQLICFGGLTEEITGNAAEGAMNDFTYQWQSSLNGTNWNDIAMATSISYAPGNLDESTYYRRRAMSQSGCGTKNSNVITIRVYEALQPGSIGKDQTVCYNSKPALLSGNKAAGANEIFTYQWQYSSDGMKYDDISAAEKETYQPANLRQSTLFRRKVSSLCGQGYSNAVKIDVYDELDPGMILDDQHICYQGLPNQLVGTAASGGDNHYSYQWQSSEDNLTWSAIYNATGMQFQPPELHQATHYRRKVSSGSGCGAAFTNIVTISVYNDIAPGIIAEEQTICYNEIPEPLLGSEAQGANDSFSYQWQSSVDGTHWDNIPLASSPNYAPSNLKVTTYYRREAISQQGCGSKCSNIVPVTVHSEFQPGTIEEDQKICYESKPKKLVGLAPSGANNMYGYQWQVSSDGIEFHDIAGEIAETYQPGHLTESKYYRRMVSSNCGNTFTNAANIQVYEKLDPGTIGDDQHICYSTDPSLLSGILPTGGDGTFAFQWLHSFDGQQWQVIPLATEKSYQPVALTNNMQYQRKVISPCGTDLSNIVTISVMEEIKQGDVGSSQTLCFGETPEGLNGSPGVGGDNAFTYQWQFSTEGKNWTNIPGAISLNYQPGSLENSLYYRRLANTSCGQLESNIVPVVILPSLNAGHVVSDQNICYGTRPAPLSGSLPAGGTGSYHYQWQFSENGNIWNDIANATFLTYQPDSLVSSTFYRRRVISGNKCGNAASNKVKIEVYKEVHPGILSTPTSICYDTQPEQLTGSEASGGGNERSYRWFSSTDGHSWNEIQQSDNVSYQPTTLTKDTWFKRMVINSCNTMFTDSIFVDVYEKLIPGMLSHDQIICFMDQPDLLQGDLASGGSKTWSYTWEYSLDGTSWNEIPGAKHESYQPEELAFGTYYRRKVVDDRCGTKTSNMIHVAVNNKIEIPKVPYRRMYCKGENITLEASDGNLIHWYDENYNWKSTGRTIHLQNIQHDTLVYCTDESENGCRSEHREIQVKIDPVQAAFKVSQDTMNLEESCSFMNTSEYAVDYLWNFSAGEPTFEKDPWRVFNEPGWNSVQLIAYSENNCTDTLSVANAIYVLPSTSAIPKRLPRISIYPNPVKDKIQVLFENQHVYHSIQVFDATGNAYIHKHVLKKTTLDVSHLLPGIYVVVVSNHAASKTYKILKYE